MRKSLSGKGHQTGTVFRRLKRELVSFLKSNFLNLVKTNLKAYHIGDNGFGGAFKNVEDMVVDFNHDGVVIPGIFLYFYQISGKNTQFQ
jgi:hypothetical protein